MEKTRWFETSPNNVSSSRIMSMIWLIVSLPMLYMLVFAIRDIATNPELEFTWEKAILLISIFVIIITGWIAPKALKSFAEENGLLSQMLAKENEK